MKSYHDIEGDGGSRVVEQVERQQARVAASLDNVRHVVAIGSGKGGVGKSTLALQLATALRRADHPVAILDADLNGPTQARQAGLGAAPLVPGPDGMLAMPRAASGIGIVSLGSLVPDTEAVDFRTVAEGDSHIWRATREFTFLGQLLAAVRWGRLDFLLVDLPPGAERTFQYAQFLGARAAFVLVTIPSDLSRSVVSRSIAALANAPNPLVGYVENMSGYYCSGCGQTRPLFPASDPGDLGIPCLGRVPFDPALAAPGAEAAPRVGEALDAIAAKLVTALDRDGEETTS